MSLKKEVLSGVVWTTIQQFSTQGLGFFVSIILARLLLPSDFGIIALLSVFITIGNVLVQSGMSQSIIRIKDTDEQDYSTVFWFNLVVSILVYIVMYFAAPYISAFYNKVELINIIRIYGFVFIINSISIVQVTMLTKELNFKKQFLISLPSLLISSIVGIVMAIYGFGIWSLVATYMVQASVTAISYLIFIKWKPQFIFNLDKFKLHFNFGVKLTASNIISALFMNLNAIIIGKYFSISQLGYYNRADSLQQYPVSSLGSIVNKVTFPLFAKLNNDIELKNYYRTIMQLVIYVTAPILIFSAVLAKPIFILMFTEKWLLAVPYFQILCLYGLVTPLNVYNLNILLVKGKSALMLKIETAKRIMAISIILISLKWGIYGLLWGNVLIAYLSFFINSYCSGKYISYSTWDQIKDIFSTIVLVFLIAVLLFFFNKNLIDINWIKVVAGLSLSMLLYLSFSYFLKLTPFNFIFKLVKPYAFKSK